MFALAMERVADLQVPVAWLESVRVNTPPAGLEPWDPFAAALVDLAQKQTAAALTHLQRAEAANPGFVLLRASCPFARSLALAVQGDRAAAADAYASGLYILWTRLPHLASDQIDPKAFDWHEYLVMRILCRRAEQQLFGREQTDLERYRTLVEARRAGTARGDDSGEPIRHPAELLAATNSLDSWRFDVLDTAKGSHRIEGDAVVFQVDAVTDTDWHVQALRTNLDLREGQEYTLTFHAKASEPRTVTLNAAIDVEDWHDIGLREPVSLTQEFQSFEFTFHAQNVVKNANRLSVFLGTETGTVFIKEMSLVEGK